MAEQPKEPAPENIRRNIVLGSIAAVGLGSVGGINYLAGTIVRDQKRKDMVPDYSARIHSGIIKGDFNIVGGALSEAKRYGILNEVVNAMAPNTAHVEEVPSSSEIVQDRDMRVRFHLKNLRSSVDKRSDMQVYTVLADARREQVLENIVDQLGVIIAQDKAR